MSCFRGHIQWCWPWDLLWETRRNLVFFNWCLCSYLIDSELTSAQYKRQFYESDPFDEIDESSSQTNRSKMGWYDRSKLDYFLAEFFRVHSDDFPTFCEWPWTIFENKHMGEFGFLYFSKHVKLGVDPFIILYWSYSKFMRMPSWILKLLYYYKRGHI